MALTKIKHSPRQAEPLDAAVGQRIAARRLALGLSQTVLGQMIGVSCQQVQKYENGQNRISASRLHGLSTALGLPIGALFPDSAGEGEVPEMETLRAVAATPEGHDMTVGFARIKDGDVRKALTRLVEVLARAA